MSRSAVLYEPGGDRHACVSRNHTNWKVAQGGKLTRKARPRLVQDISNMLRRLLHLAGQIQGGGDDEVGVGPAYLDLAVEPLDVELGGGHGLLLAPEPLSEAVDL